MEIILLIPDSYLRICLYYCYNLCELKITVGHLGVWEKLGNTYFSVCHFEKKKKHSLDLSAKLQIEKSVMKWFSALQINVSMDIRKKNWYFFPWKAIQLEDSSYTSYMLSCI